MLTDLTMFGTLAMTAMPHPAAVVTVLAIGVLAILRRRR